MTIVAAIEAEGGVWIGSDGLVSDESFEEDGGSKLWCPVEGVCVSVAGDTEPEILLRGNLEVRSPKRSEEGVDWARRVFLPACHELLEEFLKRDSSEWPDILVAARGQVIVCAGSAYRPSDGFTAIGSGSQAAKCLLAALGGKPKSRLTKTIRTVCKFVPGCGGKEYVEWVPT